MHNLFFFTSLYPLYGQKCAFCGNRPPCRGSASGQRIQLIQKAPTPTLSCMAAQSKSPWAFRAYPPPIFLLRRKKSHRQTACGIFDVMATPHNSARKLSERFCAGSKFRKRGNTVCSSRFWNCGTGAKYPLRSADAIVRCCLKVNSHALGPFMCRGSPPMSMGILHQAQEDRFGDS